MDELMMTETAGCGASRQTAMVVIENFGACNMRCTYCFPEHMWQRQGRTGLIDWETYQGTLEQVFATTAAESVEVRLAGGEPLLAGQTWLKQALDVARAIAARHGKEATFSLQTNATRVTPALARFLAANQVLVGVSLDGPPEINDRTRGQSEGTLRGYRLLSEAFGRRPSVIVTVTSCNARAMPQVIDFLEALGVVHFRANQMGATAPWNAHAAPSAAEWAAARRDIFTTIAARRGRIAELNLSVLIGKFVRTLLAGDSPFGEEYGCHGMRCAAGRELMYFDRGGNAYPCPRSNVTAGARIGHYADADFGTRWDEANRALDQAMAVPDECGRCPAQVVCDYGCHAFNVAEGGFFAVTCDASKEVYGWVVEHLEDAARIFLNDRWRDSVRATGDTGAVRSGVDLPPALVRGLAEQLRLGLARFLARPAVDAAVLTRRSWSRAEIIPLTVVEAPSAAAARSAVTVRERRSG
jgi:uncharacterized protein